jgi:hypothetical protein
MHMRITIRTIFFYLLFISAVPLFSQDNGIGYTVEKTGKSFGQFPREYKVRYDLDKRWKVLDIGLTNVDFGKVSIILSVDSITENSAVLRVQSFELSNFTVPPLQVRVITGDSTNTVDTPEVFVEQKSLQPPVSNIAPIEEIYPISDPTVLILVLLTLALLGISGLLVYRVFFMKKKNPVKMDDRIDPYEEALKNLNRLKQTAWNDKNAKDFYLGIWETIRRFLGRVFEFQAMEMSTSEIVAFFRDHPVDELEEAQDIAVHVLKVCDRVKYAKYRPESGQKDQVLKDSYELVRRTREHFDRLKAAAEQQAAGTGENR